MADDIEAGFQAFIDGLFIIASNATTDIDELFRKLDMKLEECEAFQAATGGKEFITNVHYTRDLLLKDINKIYRALFSDMEAVRHLTLLDNSSYVGDIMQPAYDNCKLITNTANYTLTATGRRKYQKSTAHRDRVEIIRQRVRGSPAESLPSVFEAVSKPVRGGY